jgi:hypothetical protein
MWPRVRKGVRVAAAERVEEEWGASLLADEEWWKREKRREAERQAWEIEVEE